MNASVTDTSPLPIKEGWYARFDRAFPLRWRTAVIIVGLIIWGLTDVRARGRLEPDQIKEHMTDFTVYTEAGAAIFNGQDPYTVASPRGWHYLYPPLLAIVVAPLANLDPQWQVVIWFAVTCLAGWGSYLEFRHLWYWLKEQGGQSRECPMWLLWVTPITLMLPLLNCAQRAQLGIMLLYLLMLGARCILTSQSWHGVLAGGIALALPVAIKLTPALPAVFLCWQLLLLACFTKQDAKNWQRAGMSMLGGVIGLMLFFWAVPSAFVGTARNNEYLHSWIDRVVGNKELGSKTDAFNGHSVRNQSLTNAVYQFDTTAAMLLGGPSARQGSAWQVDASWSEEQPAERLALVAVRASLLALLVAVSWKAALRNDRLLMANAFGLACMLTLLISPLSWVHHYVLWLPALWFAPLWLWQRGNQRTAYAVSLAACGLVWAHYLFLQIAGRVGLLGLGATAWFIASVFLLARPQKAAQQAEEILEPSLRLAA